MTSYKQFYPGQYLQQSDLPGPRRAVIRESLVEKVGEEQKLVIYFQNQERGLVCNKGNAETIAGLYGEDVEDWVGQEIVLYVDPNVSFGGKRVGGIRVRAPAVKQENGGRMQVQDRGTHKITTMAPAKMDDGLEDEVTF